MPLTRKRLDPARPPRLSDQAKAYHDATPDAAIDYDEIPDLGDVDWAALAVAAPAPKPTVAVRLPEDVIAFFKKDGARGYTARMAAVLTAYARAHKSD